MKTIALALCFLAISAMPKTYGEETGTTISKDFEITLLKQHSPKNIFVLTNETVSPHVVKLLKLTNLYDPNDSLSQIVEKTQKAWISVLHGKDNRERMDLKDSGERAQIAQQVELCAKEMGLFQEQPALLHHYDYGVCHGAFLAGVRGRISRLVQAWKNGVRFDSVVFLTGERYLRNKKTEVESIEMLTDPAQSPLPFKKNWILKEGTPYATEYDMVKIVWDQVELPEDMEKALQSKVVFINAPRGTHERPNGKDTFAAWLATNPKPGTIISFSNPLLWVQQQLLGENAIANTKFAINTTAPARLDQKQYEQAMSSIVLDTVAKCLYEVTHDQKTS